MTPIALFVFQFVWFSLAWGAVAYYVIWPWSLSLDTNRRLSLWVAPQAFRVLGVGLLVPNLSPGMPMEFAIPTAAADSVTAGLAVSAFVLLHRGASWARTLVWLCTIVGVGDLLIAFPHAARSGAIAHLATQWYVPVFAGPVMVVSHIACLVALLDSKPRHESGRKRRGGPAIGGSRLTLVALSVSDLGRSVRFYRDVLGIPLDEATHDAGPVATAAQVGFHVRDFDAVHQRVLASGAKVVSEPRVEPWGRTARYLDPDGNIVSVTES